MYTEIQNLPYNLLLNIQLLPWVRYCTWVKVRLTHQDGTEVGEPEDGHLTCSYGSSIRDVEGTDWH